MDTLLLESIRELSTSMEIAVLLAVVAHFSAVTTTSSSPAGSPAAGRGRVSSAARAGVQTRALTISALVVAQAPLRWLMDLLHFRTLVAPIGVIDYIRVPIL